MTSPRFLIVRLSAIGDVVHTLPAAMDLKAAYPEGRIDWLVEPAAAPLLRRSGIVDEVIEFPTQSWRRRPLEAKTRAEITEILRGLRSKRYDAALDFQGLWKSAVPARLAGARRVIGLHTSE